MNIHMHSLFCTKTELIINTTLLKFYVIGENMLFFWSTG